MTALEPRETENIALMMEVGATKRRTVIADTTVQQIKVRNYRQIIFSISVRNYVIVQYYYQITKKHNILYFEIS